MNTVNCSIEWRKFTLKLNPKDPKVIFLTPVGRVWTRGYGTHKLTGIYSVPLRMVNGGVDVGNIIYKTRTGRYIYNGRVHCNLGGNMHYHQAAEYLVSEFRGIVGTPTWDSIFRTMGKEVEHVLPTVITYHGR